MAYQRTLKRYLPYARRATRVALDLWRMRAKNQQNQRVQAPARREVGVTNQYDRTTVYRKKNMPRRKRKQWTKFINKVNAVADKGLASHTMLKNDQITVSQVGTANQMYGIFHLYGWAGTDPVSNTEKGTGDVATLVNHDVETNGPNRKFRYTSGVMDCTIANNGDYTLEIDVYHIVHTKANVNANYESDQLIASSDQAQPTPTGTFVNQPVGLADRGATPFDFSISLKKGNKIMKKTKYILSPGQVCTFQYRDPKNRYATAAWSFGTGYVWRKVTQTWLVVAKPVPGNSTSLTSKIDIGVTRNYSYKIMDQGGKDTTFRP